MKNRVIRKSLMDKMRKKTGRIVVVTGARQTGKTTLVKNLTDLYEYISLEDPVLRDSWKEMTASEWNSLYPTAILDEVQKVPSLIESIKAVYDQYDHTRYILLGSSQLLLLKQVKESLAGRVSIFELYPLTLPEVKTSDWDDHIEPSLFIQLLQKEISLEFLCGLKPLLDKNWALKQVHWKNYLEFGHMPVMSDPDLDDEEKRDWLRNYSYTYLQRDIRDIARINDLEPFIQVQKQSALLTAQTVNFSQLAAYSSIAVNTAKKFLSYLELSYQAILLQPWSRNSLKRMVKSPKLHILDPGICRSLTNHYGDLNGHEFESAVISEMYKQIKSWGIRCECFHLRTNDGREIDFLLESEDGYYAFEIKMSTHIRKADFRHLRNLDDILDKPLLGGFILSNDRRIQRESSNLTAVPVHWFLG